jgi:hypothetical protein
MANATIKNITTINIMHHTDGADTVYIKQPDMQEMVKADALHDLGDFINMMFCARYLDDPGLQESLDRAKILYTLKKTHEQ